MKTNSVQELSHGMIEARSQNTAAVETDEEINLFLNSVSSDSEYLWIPVEEGIESGRIVIENHYMDRQLWVSIEGASKDFYANTYISGNLSGMSNGVAAQDGEHLILKFSMDRVYEYNTIYEDSVLYVEKVTPREMFDKIVVIDPAGHVPEDMIVEDSLTPARICLDIAGKLQSRLEAEGIRVYMTCLDERELSDDDCLSLAADVKPDMLIRIETAYDEDSKVYGTQTVYNGTYFIPGFGSVELADILEADVTTAIGGRASGMVCADESDVVITKATVPAATVKVGYYTNVQENILLNRDDYRAKIAQGLYKAVMSIEGKE